MVPPIVVESCLMKNHPRIRSNVLRIATRPLQSLTPQVKAVACRKRDSHHRKIPRIKEVWFPGTHSDIAGGSVVNGNLDHRLPSFLWISFEAVWAGLKLDRSNVAWKWDESADGVTWW
ncbi:hypothetical protein BU17DRAFT_63768 [Hysterangium stoloniferum]|nr:hypothetical protein BU17DRAFT_63768 [Hysterangium stoloniferum]